MNPESELKASVDRDVSCVTCGYNLRGLQEDGKCPECGEKVSDTLENVLAMADRKLLVELRKTVTVLAIVRVCLLVCVLSPVVVGIILQGQPSKYSDELMGADLILLIVSMCLYVGGLFGMAGITWDLLDTRPSMMRYLVFAAVIVMFSALLVRMIEPYILFLLIWPLTIIPLLMEAYVCGLAGSIAKKTGNKIFKRITRLAKAIVRFAVVITSLAILLLMFCGTDLQGLTGMNVLEMMNYVALGGVVVLGTILLLNAVILWRLRRILKPFCAALS